MAELDLIVVDDLDIEEEVKDFVEDNISETLYPGDERSIFIKAMTAWATQFAVKLNEKFNQRFAQYAKGEILDAHGVNEDCERLKSEYATATQRFNIAMALTFNVIVPKGTRVTGDNEKYFETTEAGVITTGSTYVDVGIKATAGGSAYNGFTAGQINRLVDQVNYISSTANITATTGGDDGEPYPYSEKHPEGDDGTGDEHYYERIKTAKSSKSTAGAESTYEYYAKSADASITDVTVVSPSAGNIQLVVTGEDGAVPTQAVLGKVLAICSSKTVRPLGDNVTAIGVQQVPYDIELTYYTTNDEESAAVAEVEGTGGAIERYNEWQSEINGRAINPDRLRAEILKSDTKDVGADYVEITKPEYTVLTTTQIAKWSGNMTVTHSTGTPS